MAFGAHRVFLVARQAGDIPGRRPEALEPDEETGASVGREATTTASMCLPGEQEHRLGTDILVHKIKGVHVADWQVQLPGKDGQAVVENPPDFVVQDGMEHFNKLQLGRRVHLTQLDHDVSDPD